MESVEGTVTAVIYRSADGYTVLDVDGSVPATVVGSLPDIKVGEYVRFFGAFKEHKIYGRQFAASSCELSLPADINDMALFLGGGFIHGLGHVLAGRIVEEFGEDTFRVIENEPESLAVIKGVSKTLALKIHEALGEYTGSRDSYAKLMGIGLTAKQALAAFNALGPGAADTVKINPYLLIQSVRGIDFKTADSIAGKIGIDINSPLRVESGILHILRKSLELGYTCVPESKLVATAVKNLGVSAEEVGTALGSLSVSRRIVRRSYPGKDDYVFLTLCYDAEHYAAVKLLTMLASDIADAVPDWEEKLERQKSKYSLSGEQADALAIAITSPVSVITGGPGTGKTTILKALTNIIAASGHDFILCAPTGRAAKRMQETCGADAKTIHRTLEYSYDKKDDASTCAFRRNEDSPLDCGTLIVDEASMIDIFLFKSLMEAVEPGTRLVIVGDANQLPSVGPGAVMEDLIESGIIPVSALTHVYRHDGGIADAAHAILEGRCPDFTEDFCFVEKDDVNEIRRYVVREYTDLFSCGEDVQLLAPLKENDLGSKELDSAVRNSVNPCSMDKDETAYGEHVFRVGDRVMQIKNNYGREWEIPGGTGEGIFNGEIGEIVRISAGSVYVDFDGKLSVYEAEDLSELAGAYAYTIHKSQGNEFGTVIIPMKYRTTPFFSRNLLYTAVTRAKKRAVLVGSKAVLEYMISNSHRDSRYTSLKSELEMNSNSIYGDRI